MAKVTKKKEEKTEGDVIEGEAQVQTPAVQNAEVETIGTHEISFNRETVELIKRTVAEGASDDELKMFLYQAKRTGLDPLARQIYFMKRNTKKGPKVTIQTSIDGFRVVAGRNKNYAGQGEPEFVENQQGKLVMARVRVYQFGPDNQRYEAAVGVAYWDEYVPKDTGNKEDFMWQKMPHTMLAKVAEAVALRKAFPQDLSGIYTDDEMMQGDNDKITAPVSNGKQLASGETQTPPPAKRDNKATDKQKNFIRALAGELGRDVESVQEKIKGYYKLDSFNDLSFEQASEVIKQYQERVSKLQKEGNPF